jgi:1-acyl-sn-glycerol-3-phosphate acyltransferase
MLIRAWRKYAYPVFYPVCGAFFSLGFSLRVEGYRHIPMRGGLLVVANHQSFFDPVICGLAARRRLTYMARKSLFKSRPFAFLIESLGALPIDQEASAVEGMRLALDSLHTGKALLVFPEGERTPDGSILPFKRGVGLLIRKSQAPVLPIGIAGAFEAFPRHRPYPTPAPIFLPNGGNGIAAVIGPPISRAQLQALPPAAMLDHVRNTIVDLRAKAEKLRRK